MTIIRIMKKRAFGVLLTLYFMSSGWAVRSQELYFPPAGTGEWDTVSAVSLGWCTEELDILHAFLQEKHTKAFLILEDGRIAVEWYFDSFTRDSLWYWASAGKTLTAFLVGIAQEQGYLDIQLPSSTYLGEGWTDCPPEKESLIKIWNQLTMTSGLDDGVADNHCTLDTCLLYLADAGSRWAYHNAPYTLLEQVLENATGKDINIYTQQTVKSATGMDGLWLKIDYDNVYFSTARSMARFGLLALNRGVWNGDTLLKDKEYFDQMVNTSQDLNLSYGYLWWLNGKGTHMLPGVQFIFPTDLIPDAPDDLVAGLGKNDQKVYVIPSRGMVVVRMGNSAGQPMYALSSFDNELWGKINRVLCNNQGIGEHHLLTIYPYPNPVGDRIIIDYPFSGQESVIIHDPAGREVFRAGTLQKSFRVNIPPGFYVLSLVDRDGAIIATTKLIKR